MIWRLRDCPRCVGTVLIREPEPRCIDCGWCGPTQVGIYLDPRLKGEKRGQGAPERTFDISVKQDERDRARAAAKTRRWKRQRGEVAS